MQLLDNPLSPLQPYAGPIRLGAKVLLGVVAAAALFNTYADLQIKGPFGIGFHYQGWKPRALADETTIKGFASAQAAALKLAIAQRDAAEQRYRDLAKGADHEHDLARDVALDAADRYVAGHRIVCPSDSSAAGATFTPAGAVHSALPGAVPTAAFVAVGEADVRACSGAAAYAVAAHNWAVKLAPPPASSSGAIGQQEHP